MTDPNRTEDKLREAIIRGRRGNPPPAAPIQEPVQEPVAGADDAPAHTGSDMPATGGGRKRIIVEADTPTIDALRRNGSRVIELGGDDGGGNISGGGGDDGPVRRNRPRRRRGSGFRPWRALRRLGLWLGIPLLAGAIAIGPVLNSPDVGSRYDAARAQAAQDITVVLAPNDGGSLGDIFRPIDDGIPDANQGVWHNYKSAWLHGLADMVDSAAGGAAERIDHAMLEAFPQEQRAELLEMIGHIKSDPGTGKEMGEYEIVDAQSNGELTVAWTSVDDEGVSTDHRTVVPATFAHNFHFLEMTEHMKRGTEVAITQWNRTEGYMIGRYQHDSGVERTVYIHQDNVDKYRALAHRLSTWDSPFTFSLENVEVAKERFSYLMSLIRSGTELNIAARADGDGFDLTYTSGRTGNSTTYHLSREAMGEYKDMFDELRSAKAALESQRAGIEAPASADRLEQVEPEEFQPEGNGGLRPGTF
ncbi:MAG: hypothetical protein Alpg2KO_01440 [Alphaproteobacteria bacterium]